MSLPKSPASYSRMMKKLQVWSLLLGTILFFALLIFKATVCDAHIDLIELPSKEIMQEAWEKEGYRELKTEKDWENYTPDKEDIS